MGNMGIVKSVLFISVLFILAVAFLYGLFVAIILTVAVGAEYGFLAAPVLPLYIGVSYLTYRFMMKIFLKTG